MATRWRSATQAAPALTQPFIETRGETGNAIRQTRQLRSGLHSVAVYLSRRNAKGDVLSQGCLEQKHVLRNIGDARLPGAAIRIPQPYLVHLDMPRLRQQQTAHQIEQGSLARA